MSEPPRVPLSIGIRIPHSTANGTANALRDLVARAEEAGIDRLCVGDHVTFNGGQGYDGLLQAAVLATATRGLEVETSIYQLPLRHPVPVARQVSNIAQLAPGRFIFGVGIGGEDEAEYRACGVDPRSRGRRMDEALGIVRALLDGQTVTSSGEFFPIDQVKILPVPSQRVPIIVGGRSDAAARRVAAQGDGWLGLWVSAQRYTAVTQRIEDLAGEQGRSVDRWLHRMYAWCGVGDSRGTARPGIKDAMEQLYRIPFERFERYCPMGSPEDIAEALLPFVEAGCRAFDLNAVALDPETAVAAVARVKQLLAAEDRG